MAFVNEYGTEEDIEKYKLAEAWIRFDPTRDPPFHGRKPELTIDRENDVVLMVRGSGPVSGGTQYYFVMSIRGQLVSPSLNLVKGSSGRMDERPFYRVWDLVGIKKEPTCSLDDSEIIQNVKRAITAFGYAGVHHQVPNTVVKFNF